MFSSHTWSVATILDSASLYCVPLGDGLVSIYRLGTFPPVELRPSEAVVHPFREPCIDLALGRNLGIV